MTSGLIRSNLLRENKAMSLPLLSLNAAPGVSSSTLRLGDASKHCGTLATARRSDGYPRSSSPRGVRKTTMTRLNAAGFAEVEPDLNEDPVDRWETPSIDPEDFLYGIYDGHHTYHEGEDKGNFWEILQEEYASAEPPTGFQGVISWLFLPTVALAMYLDVPGEYLYIGAALYTAVFCIIEMNKPDKPHNFEPQIYNMERGARDKLIADYNSMDIWDFNEKYGDLWDFTVKKDDITGR